ncbi:MAG: lysylphosphatidylglycerol synthase domain-containing protein [Ekhidna sp.]
MQVKDQTVIRIDKYAILGKLAKAVITALCFYFLWNQYQKHDIDFGNIEWNESQTWALIGVFLLMILNWYLEALRWKISLNPFEKISINEAFSSVLGGIALNWVMPFTTGDFAARLLKRKDKYQTTSAILLNRGIMLSLTGIFGLFSFRYLHQSFISNISLQIIGMLLILIVLFFGRKRLSRFFAYFSSIESKRIFQVISISVLRYLVFTFQFYWLVVEFNSGLSSLLIIAGIGWVFFVRSIIPHLLGGIGLREAAAVFFFTPHVSDLHSIVLPVFLIWMINTMIPSLFGLLFVWRADWDSISRHRNYNQESI